MNGCRFNSRPRTINNMPCDDAIIKPVKGKNSPKLGPVAVMVSSEIDLRFLCGLMALNENDFRNLFLSRLYVGDSSTKDFSLSGPLIGAPYATMLMESLIAWGARKIIFFGWCGAVSHRVKIGDIIVPTCAIIDEGTSKGYCADENSISRPSGPVLAKTKEVLTKSDLEFHEGIIWTTDAIYRETREKVEYFQAKDAIAVEMEMSALFTVGKYRNVEVGGIFVVSDELATFEWRPGFREKRFKKSRMAVCEVISSLCQVL